MEHARCFYCLEKLALKNSVISIILDINALQKKQKNKTKPQTTPKHPTKINPIRTTSIKFYFVFSLKYFGGFCYNLPKYSDFFLLLTFDKIMVIFPHVSKINTTVVVTTLSLLSTSGQNT